MAGLSPALVGMIERGDRTNIAAATAIALARTLGTTAEYLITGDGEPPSDADARAAAERARGAARPLGAGHTANDFTVDRSPDFNQTGTGG